MMRPQVQGSAVTHSPWPHCVTQHPAGGRHHISSRDRESLPQRIVNSVQNGQKGKLRQSSGKKSRKREKEVRVG